MLKLAEGELERHTRKNDLLGTQKVEIQKCDRVIVVRFDTRGYTREFFASAKEVEQAQKENPEWEFIEALDQVRKYQYYGADLWGSIRNDLSTSRSGLGI